MSTYERWSGRAFRILLNALFLLVLFSAAAVREGRIFGIATGQAVPVVPAPTADELAAGGFPGAVLQSLGPGLWTIQAADGIRIGSVGASAAFDRSAGYAGPIPLHVYLDAAGNVKAVRILPNNETPSFMKQLLAAGFLDNWVGKPARAAARLTPDVVSGATLSSAALTAGVRQTLAALSGGGRMTAAAVARPLVKTIAAWLVVLLAVWLAFRSVRQKKLRPFILVLNVAVIGFWAGQALSLAGMFSWLGSGTPLPFGLVLLLGGGVLLPLLGKPGFYCNWVCPYGAAQELAGRVFRRKAVIPPRLLALLRHLREVLLFALLVLLWLGAGAGVLQYEPFTAFLPVHATLPVLLLAGAFLLLSLFVQRPWCRFFCPTGALLAWITRK